MYAHAGDRAVKHSVDQPRLAFNTGPNATGLGCSSQVRCKRHILAEAEHGAGVIAGIQLRGHRDGHRGGILRTWPVARHGVAEPVHARCYGARIEYAIAQVPGGVDIGPCSSGLRCAMQTVYEHHGAFAHTHAHGAEQTCIRRIDQCDLHGGRGIGTRCRSGHGVDIRTCGIRRGVKEGTMRHRRTNGGLIGPASVDDVRRTAQ